MAFFDRTGTELALADRLQQGVMPLSQAINRLFQDSFWMPSFFDGLGPLAAGTGTNLWQTGDSYIVQIAMPGMKPDSIACTVDQQVLTVKAEPSLQVPEGAKAIWQSFGGQTEYRVQLPAEVESDSAEATYDAGILTIKLPKAAHARTHAIKVQAK